MNLKTNDDVHDLIGAPWQLASLIAALKLGLFWYLADQRRSTADIEVEMNIPPSRCFYWLSILATMNLLDQEGDHFWISPLAKSAILDVYSQGAWKMLAIDAEDNLEESLFLAQRLQDPAPKKDEYGRYPYQMDSYVQKMVVDLERARYFCNLLYELHTPLAQDVAEALDVNGSRSLLDLGGGSGVVSLALLRKYPWLTATVADIANVCIAGREIADGQPERDRISYVTVNFGEEELPKGFDIVLKCDVGVFDEALLSKMAAAVNDGGQLVIVDRWYKIGERENSGYLSFQLSKTLRNPEYSLPSLEAIGEYLTKIGLTVESTVELPYHRWKMIQARKMVPVRAGQNSDTDFIRSVTKLSINKF